MAKSNIDVKVRVVKQIPMTVILGAISILELIVSRQMPYSFVLWLAYGVYSILKDDY